MKSYGCIYDFWQVLMFQNKTFLKFFGKFLCYRIIYSLFFFFMKKNDILFYVLSCALCDLCPILHCVLKYSNFISLRI